ncbi:MAG: DegT/DnrJ/EryC1/StrS family aminotransferase [Candidatus Hydrothermales bacterium]
MIKPAILGNPPAFDFQIPISKPFTPKVKDIKDKFSEIFLTGQITNGKYVKEFEDMICDYLNVPYAICVSSCTLGLVLTIKALSLEGSKFIVPSFTFPATVTPLLWNNIEPKFVDIDSQTFNISIESIEESIDKDTKGILAVHVYGTPCDVESLERLAKKYNLVLLFDAAHAFGSKFKGSLIGSFGEAEVFSLSPTKTVVAGEGGVITTKNKVLAEKLRILRNYGDPGTNNFEYLGLNSRLSELHAILGIFSLKRVEEEVERRNELANIYMENLKDIPGISFQKVKEYVRSTFKDFSIIIDEEKFGLKRDILKLALEKENIQVKRYFYPPCHKQKLFGEKYKDLNLKVTEKISLSVISLPIYSTLNKKDVIKICNCIKRIFDFKEEIKSYLSLNEW